VDIHKQNEILKKTLLDIWGDGGYKDIAAQMAYDGLKEAGLLPENAKRPTDYEVNIYHQEALAETRKEKLPKQTMGLRT